MSDQDTKLNLCAVAMALGRDQFLVLIREPCRGAWKHAWLGEVGDNGLPALPGPGFWVWNDVGSRMSDGGEYPDESGPEWSGAWLRMSAEQALAWAHGVPPWESSADDPVMREQARLHSEIARAEERADGYFFEMSALRSDASLAIAQVTSDAGT